MISRFGIALFSFDSLGRNIEWVGDTYRPLYKHVKKISSRVHGPFHWSCPMKCFVNLKILGHAKWNSYTWIDDIFVMVNRAQCRLTLAFSKHVDRDRKSRKRILNWSRANVLLICHNKVIRPREDSVEWRTVPLVRFIGSILEKYGVLYNVLPEMV